MGCRVPITIADWMSLHDTDGGLARIHALVDAERSANQTSRAWVTISDREQIDDQWQRIQQLKETSASLPLFGVPFAVKDNIDAASFPTTAACPAFSEGPVKSDSTVVRRLKAAGAILVGKTNLDQFATGLVGTRSPYGAVPNSFDPTRVSGGSSSGSAVVVARGIVPFSLGTDTAGSGRVPAGLNNVIGLKPTRGAISTYGVVPACRTLDCVSIFALTLADAHTVLTVAEGYDSSDCYSRERPPHTSPAGAPSFGSKLSPTPRLAICTSPPWFGDESHRFAYENALQKASQLGWEIVPVDFDPLFELAQLLYSGPWVAERYQAIRSFIQAVQPEKMDPVVRSIIVGAENLSAADVFSGEYSRQSLTRQIEAAFASFDGLLVPTTPTFPTLQDLVVQPIAENSKLGTYTNFVNFLDWSALSIPAGFRVDGLPFGITLVSNRWREPQLVGWARQWLGSEQRQLGATNVKFTENTTAETTPSTSPTDTVAIAVVGAHLSGFPLNKDLVNRGATLDRTTFTSTHYRLYSLKTKGVQKPGLKRDLVSHGSEIEVEVWHLPAKELASFMATIPSPLSIGKLELCDGSWVHGFVCEPFGFQDAADITSFGGWRAYMSQQERHGHQVMTRTRNSPIKRVLVANRGEIAVRIINTLHKMELVAVAIYSAIDAEAPHVRLADHALALEGESVLETYLNMSQIIELALSLFVDAVIPGYGFLSENTDFATAVQDAGMVWIGPTPQQMSKLGLKHEAREIANAVGVPTVPGSRGLLTTVEQAIDEAGRIGYPLMLKSTAGGGGIGLSLCNDQQALEDAFEGVQRQAKANFANDGVFLERFVKRARHVEVQILGDGLGKVVAAGERDCSLQRRHQKVVEESPACMIPQEIREMMKASAVKLTSSVNYRNVGTVEFIYDIDTHEFYFLEINTRLQVEHPVTESVTGLDLVECMIRIASGDFEKLFPQHGDVAVFGASIEVRVYAESPLQQFRPCAGVISVLQLPETLRVDTWVEKGTVITTSYDALIAKFISFGADRAEALQKMAAGLAVARIDGVETNLDYLRAIVASEMFQSGQYSTKLLDSFQFASPRVEIIEPGALATIQDHPGRTGYWSVGIPPSGPMDDYSFCLANQTVGNRADAAGLECTLVGPTLKFHCEALVAVTGGEASVTVDQEAVSMNEPLKIHAGQVLRVGAVEHGYRVYLAIRGGLDVPVVMGSRATFDLGHLGGLQGRKLRPGDLLTISPLEDNISSPPTAGLSSSLQPALIARQPHAEWVVRVTPGPHGAPDYFTSGGLTSLFSSQWKVHHNSNRLGVRLTGPRPEWARSDGGEAGLHPSNIHDSPYSIGSISFTGDEAVILTRDGPSLGGFVVFCVIVSADMWKIGQVRPGDSIKLELVDVEAAINLAHLPASSSAVGKDIEESLAAISVIVGQIESGDRHIRVRQAGDRAVVLEFGTIQGFDLGQSFDIAAFCELHARTPIPGIEELTPGVFTLHIVYAYGLLPKEIMHRIEKHITGYTIPSSFPSRIIKLPLAFDDEASRAAVTRYASTIRDTAPWLPSNVKFLEQLNGTDDIAGFLYASEFLVIGLGDVFMGSPCALPLDPRHRLFGTKYNPSRSFTPRGSVGVGGQYMCIYATESPGGYQLVGRTVNIWDSDKVPIESSAVNTYATSDDRRPWLFHGFDRITFYPVSERDLDTKPYNELVHISDGVLVLQEYRDWIEANNDDIAMKVAQQQDAISKAPFLAELGRLYQRKASVGVSSITHGTDGQSVSGQSIKAALPGRCYKLCVQEGETISKGTLLLYIESSKMEVEIRSPVDGICTSICVKSGDIVVADDCLVVIDGS
ncbi:hypothetical protein S40293_04060 [Stachybotrys chartarum IBT 40293]|nr:hypothetical protein S40293_04060 [Stachybotrys chartarum IBT 40293]